ncbi:18995_t:CDS:2, partial [Gigaspora margarita]
QQNFKLYTNLEATTTLDTNKLNSNTNNKNDNKEYSKLEEEGIYEDNEEFISEKDFEEYLQGWAELLEEEQDNKDRVNFEDLDDIVHSTLDKDAKWQLKNL